MDRISSIKFAIENESTEMVFYQKQADRTKNQVARALFQTLADDEKEHVSRIKTLHEKLVSDGTCPEDVPIDVAGTNIESVLRDIREDASGADDHTADDIEAFKKGAAFEKKAFEFYAALA